MGSPAGYTGTRGQRPASTQLTPLSGTALKDLLVTSLYIVASERPLCDLVI